MGSAKYLQVGDLVVAIGNPMGSMYSIGYGLIGSEPSKRYLTDRKISLYCTNLQYVSNGGGKDSDFRSGSKCDGAKDLCQYKNQRFTFRLSIEYLIFHQVWPHHEVPQ